MKYKILTIMALTGSAVAELFGGWDMALQTLVIFMAVDWITGGIILPGVFEKTVGSRDFGEKCRNVAARAVIKNGSTGTLPAIAEGILAAKGFYRGNIDAVFGNDMETAVRSFQKAQSLETDGIIGKETWSRLLKEYDIA